MDIFLAVLGVIWVIGWLKQLAIVDAAIERSEISRPENVPPWAIPVILFFTWPYFYFYYKA